MRTRALAAIAAVAVIAALGVARSGAAPADPPVDVKPLLVGGRVLVSFSAPGAFTSDVQVALRTGLPMTFTYIVELRRPSAIWFDHTLATTTLGSSVRFDNLTSTYQVSKLVEGKVVWSESTPGEDQMRAWAMAFDRVPMPTVPSLEPNVEYYVQVHVRTTPHRTFFLWPWGRDDAGGRADFTFIR